MTAAVQATAKHLDRRTAVEAGRRSRRTSRCAYFVVLAGAVLDVDFLWLLLLCEPLLCELLCFELEDFPEVEDCAEPDVPAAGWSAAIAAAARPRVNKTEVISVPDLFMDSPTVVVVTGDRKNTRER